MLYLVGRALPRVIQPRQYAYIYIYIRPLKFNNTREFQMFVEAIDWARASSCPFSNEKRFLPAWSFETARSSSRRCRRLDGLQRIITNRRHSYFFASQHQCTDPTAILHYYYYYRTCTFHFNPYYITGRLSFYSSFSVKLLSTGSHIFLTLDLFDRRSIYHDILMQFRLLRIWIKFLKK